MRRVLPILVALPAMAVIVDRAAVSVAGAVITASDIHLRIRLTAFQNKENAAITIEARRRAAERLIEQRIIEREMDVGHYPRLAENIRKQLVPDYAAGNFDGDPRALRQRLAAYGLTPKDLEDDLARQADVLTFLNLRFRQVVEGAQANSEATNRKADADLDAWIGDQRKRIRITYLDPELKPPAETKP